jgi:hypothetical protein
MSLRNQQKSAARRNCLKLPDITGAARPMKMGTIASLWHYDLARDPSRLSANLR